MKLPTLLRRFPSWRVPISSWSPIPSDKRAAYSSMADDFIVLDREVNPHFQESDRAALDYQNRYRRQQVIILLGSVVVSSMGGLQAVFPEQRWPGVLLAVLGIALAATSRVSGELGALNEFLTQRVKAERLRALHFRFLSQTGPYVGPERELALRRAVLAVKAGNEPS